MDQLFVLLCNTCLPTYLGIYPDRHVGFEKLSCIAATESE